MCVVVCVICWSRRAEHVLDLLKIWLASFHLIAAGSRPRDQAKNRHTDRGVKGKWEIVSGAAKYQQGFLFQWCHTSAVISSNSLPCLSIMTRLKSHQDNSISLMEWPEVTIYKQLSLSRLLFSSYLLISVFFKESRIYTYIHTRKIHCIEHMQYKNILILYLVLSHFLKPIIAHHFLLFAHQEAFLCMGILLQTRCVCSFPAVSPRLIYLVWREKFQN